MTITRWIPRSSLINYHNEIDHLLNSVYGTETDSKNECSICPIVDIEELDKSYSLHIELPGVGKKDVNINVKENILTIDGEKKSEKNSKSDKYHRYERVFGKFRRTFRLPDLVDKDQIEAGFSDGVLTITIPKLEEALPKQIEVKIK
ncbi:Hsp20/alpha crystallin family protein [bacterium]|nr:Hsp20/alpha crystallin family protein [bacterium]MBU1063287.1 Hsp20/alpha crystallin family protein [bacterium]MBU1632921.1 Hsp20/alpha crystallin family protein [bacterium]MBU1873284.1 Hsp20/alpha crystallin family protein [bacterium]